MEFPFGPRGALGNHVSGLMAANVSKVKEVEYALTIIAREDQVMK